MDLPSRIGRYDVVRLLGQGGMGRVVLARDSVLGRYVAVKTLREDLALPPDLRTSLVERMRNEATAAAALTHPNMVTIHDMGEDEAHGLYLVFEYVEGPTLRERLEDGPLPADEIAMLARELGSALTDAHAAGVIHRDVKPENVMLSRYGGKLADFGIARIPESTLTQVGMPIGTPAYSAPEAIAKSEFSPRSDQFSLASTLFEALSGRRAFEGDDALAIASAIHNGTPAPLDDDGADARRRALLRRAEPVLRRALSRDNAERFENCLSFGESLAAAIEGPRPSGAFATLPPIAMASIVPRATRRWQNLIAGAAVLVIAGLVIWGREGGSGVSLMRVQAELHDAMAAPPPKPSARPPASANATSRPKSPSKPLDAGAFDAASSPTDASMLAAPASDDGGP